ncbi:MAG: TRAP transporter small permease subunit [Opitutales bacterium]|jgi:TRAP-type mannitol/chloroaromatic compound transport system permease small subunit|nr:TRAP transporter small permease subunit [Opitutales bacterium]MBT5168655.1 TRAP transporter small permease subunit [Opitutales bacterium]MBT5815675.1 TRAP transporter small permease subunit [Opitutales bacterium]MBT6770194.1 TRAP transporter small permease subunit [Opitutales bacterium]MDG2256251.1 TRAP transporter small permease subunit [Opitutaceae bacterium]
MKSFARRIESFITAVGCISSWSIAALLVATVAQVLLRYAFGKSYTILEDSLWYLFSMTLVLGLSYTMTSDGHIRVDFLYQAYSPKMKRIVDLISIVLFLLPLYAFLAWHGWEYAAKSFSINERSPNPGGMPWLWLVKGLLPFSCLLLILESLARACLILIERPSSPSYSVHGS